jgi:hypothetical protein
MIRQLFSATLVVAAAGASPLVDAAEPAPSARIAPTPAAQQRPGYGVVEQVIALRRADAEPSASAGSSGPGGASPSRSRGSYLVKVRMEDGTIQVRSQRRGGFSIGERVLLTNAGDVVPD